MLKKMFFTLWSIFLLGQLAVAQSTFDAFAKVGFNANSFQDEKYSDIIYTGPGMLLNFGFEKETERAFLGGGLYLSVGAEFANLHDNGFVISAFPRFYVNYLKKVNPDFAVGAHLDLLSFYYRNTQGLMNNGNYYQTGSDLLLSAQWTKGKFRFGADLGLASFIKEGTSFAFSAPQSGLENGEFDYQNDALGNPFGLRYGDLRFFDKRQVIMTHAEWQLKPRFALGYRWEMRRITNVTDLSATTGRHHLTFRFNLIHKEKEAISNF